MKNDESFVWLKVQEIGGNRIRIGQVSPGAVLTEMSGQIDPDDPIFQDFDQTAILEAEHVKTFLCSNC